MKKKRAQGEHTNYERKKNIGKGKYVVKVVNQPCKKFKTTKKQNYLRDAQNKTHKI